MVVALAIDLGRVMRVPEKLQQPLQRRLRRIELDADHLRVAGRPGGDLLVGRVRPVATGITTDDGLHPGKELVSRLGAPEAAAAEDEELGGRGGFVSRSHGKGEEGDETEQ